MFQSKFFNPKNNKLARVLVTSKWSPWYSPSWVMRFRGEKLIAEEIVSMMEYFQSVPDIPLDDDQRRDVVLSKITPIPKVETEDQRRKNLAKFAKQNRRPINNNYPYGIQHKTSGDHYVVTEALGTEFELQQIQRTYNPPSVDINGRISFPKAISTVSKEYLNSEFLVLNLDGFLEKFPELKDHFICSKQNPIQGDGAEDI